MEQLKLEYIAGFFDGEGCIVIQKIIDTDTRKKRCPSLRVIITNTNLLILKQIEKYFYSLGIEGKITIKRRNPSDIRKPCYQWVLWCNRAFNFLKIIHPYLIVKKEQALLGMEYINTIGKTKQKGLRNKNGIYISEEIIEKRKEIINKLSKMKHE
jgi:intein/homing endonuclease